MKSINMKSINLQRRNLHIIRTVINCGKHKYYKDEDVLKACIIEEGKCGATRRPTFRIAYTNINNPIKLISSVNFREKEAVPLLSSTIPSQYKDNNLIIESMYFNDIHAEALDFQVDNAAFPNKIGKKGLKDIVMNPPSAVLVLATAGFNSVEFIKRMNTILTTKTKVVSSISFGLPEKNLHGYIFPTTKDTISSSTKDTTTTTTTTINDKTINDKNDKIDTCVITGATGIALFGNIELDELAQYCKRVNGQYLLRSFMPDDIEKILFVPTNIPELLKKKTKLDNDTKYTLEPGKVIYNLPLFSIGEIIFPGQELNVNIFEPRYRKMLKQCLEESSYFGVNLVGSSVGTIVKVESINQINPITGEAQVTLRGCCRFKSLGKFIEQEEAFGLISAMKVQCFVDEESKKIPTNDELLTEAEGIIRYYGKAHNLDLPMSFFDSTEKISFFMAFLCTTFTSAPQKQYWLEQKDSYARLSEAVKLLREFTTAAYNKNM